MSTSGSVFTFYQSAAGRKLLCQVNNIDEEEGCVNMYPERPTSDQK